MSLGDIPPARSNILALSLNQQWEKTGLTAGQSEPPDGAKAQLSRLRTKREVREGEQRERGQREG